MRSLRLAKLAPLLVFLPCLAACSGDRADGTSRSEAPLTVHNGWRQVWLEYDYMVGADGHSHAPDPAGIAEVVSAFRAHGIQLHIDPKHDAIPEKLLTFGGGCPSQYAYDYWSQQLGGAADFYDLEQQYSSHRPGGHYAIFGHYYCESLGSSGIAELPGNDFIVTLGPAYTWVGPYFTHDEFVTAEAGTLMHELGHNLGLWHGGFENQNDKPNYLSVMSYTFQFIGIPFASAPGSDVRVGRRLDYSATKLPTLDERNLDENAGVGSGTSDLTIYSYVDPNSEWGFTSKFAPTSGPIDWNGDGVLSSGITADINLSSLSQYGCWPPTSCPDAAYTRMEGHDDWSALDVNFTRPPGFEHRHLPTVAMCQGLSLEELRKRLPK